MFIYVFFECESYEGVGYGWYVCLKEFCSCCCVNKLLLYLFFFVGWVFDFC